LINSKKLRAKKPEVQTADKVKVSGIFLQKWGNFLVKSLPKKQKI